MKNFGSLGVSRVANWRNGFCQIRPRLLRNSSPMRAIEIRTAEEEDTDSVVKLSRNARLFQFPDWLWALLIWMCWVRVLVVQREIVGYESFVPLFGVAYLMQIAIDPKHQESGLGTLLTKWVLYRLQEDYGVSRVYACTYRSNVVTWCRKLGFHVVSCARKKLWILGKRLESRR